MLGALGVVYGDIGTSPLYAFRESLHASGGLTTAREVLGLLSLIVWALTMVVTVKYVSFVLRADNNGEGGTLSLMTLAGKAFAKRPAWILALGIVGGSLFLGRCDHHAGHFGAVRGRGHRGRGAEPGAVGGAG